MPQIYPTIDRRSPNRRPLPPCPRCADHLASVALRSPSALLCQCRSCNKLWTVPKATLHMQPPVR
jgi:hypothetical protein